VQPIKGDILERKALALGPVTRSIKLLQYLGEHGHTTIKDASAALSLAPSTVHRLLDLLGKENIVEHNQIERNYRIGPEFFRLAAKVYERYDVRALSIPVLTEIVGACDETCLLGLYLPVVGKMTFAAKVDSSRALRYQIPLNTQISVFWGASGRSILAFLPKEDIDRIHRQEAPSPATGEAVTSRQKLEKELAEIRSNGIAMTRGQKTPGAVGISTPLFAASGTVIGSLSVTVPASELTAAKEKQIRSLLKVKSAELSVRLGVPTRLG
jgi:DNA-binding IclR family transcriptional regulator